MGDAGIDQTPGQGSSGWVVTYDVTGRPSPDERSSPFAEAKQPEGCATDQDAPCVDAPGAGVEHHGEVCWQTCRWTGGARPVGTAMGAGHGSSFGSAHGRLPGRCCATP